MIHLHNNSGSLKHKNTLKWHTVYVDEIRPVRPAQKVIKLNRKSFCSEMRVLLQKNVSIEFANSFWLAKIRKTSILKKWKKHWSANPSANCACAIPLIDGLGRSTLYVYSWSSASSSRRVWQRLATVVESMRESIHVLSWDYLSLQGMQSKHIQGKPVLICILACSLGFHAITFERSVFTKIASLKSSKCCAEPVGVDFWRSCCA